MPTAVAGMRCILRLLVLSNHPLQRPRTRELILPPAFSQALVQALRAQVARPIAQQTYDAHLAAMLADFPNLAALAVHDVSRCLVRQHVDVAREDAGRNDRALHETELVTSQEEEERIRLRELLCATRPGAPAGALPPWLTDDLDEEWWWAFVAAGDGDEPDLECPEPGDRDRALRDGAGQCVRLGVPIPEWLALAVERADTFDAAQSAWLEELAERDILLGDVEDRSLCLLPPTGRPRRADAPRRRADAGHAAAAAPPGEGDPGRRRSGWRRCARPRRRGGGPPLPGAGRSPHRGRRVIALPGDRAPRCHAQCHAGLGAGRIGACRS